jgi:hypothetical protein
VTGGADIEIVGTPLNISPSLGIFHTTYSGWGLEAGVNASLRVGHIGAGNLTGGLGLSDNSQNGLTISPSLSFAYSKHLAGDAGTGSAGVQFTTPYNSRAGLKDIQLGLTSSWSRQTVDACSIERKTFTSGASWPIGSISFSWPAYTPTISMPLTNNNVTFTAKWGGEVGPHHPSFFVSGYAGSEFVAATDTSLSLPAFGYLNFQNRNNSWNALMDFNREKEMPYRDNPPVPHIAVPSYTYDVFTISGEGTGGMFRAYRGDIGFIADHQISNKTSSGALSIDFGAGNMVHGGVDFNNNYSTTTSGPWLSENPLANTINFKPSNGLYEAAYFRNPGEKAINTTDFYKALGGDNIAVAGITQNGSSIATTNTLGLYNGGKLVGLDTLTSTNAVRTTRDKRSQVITYLTASEAEVSGLDKTIDRYDVNQFDHSCPQNIYSDSAGNGTGLVGYFYPNETLSGKIQDSLAGKMFDNWDSKDPLYYSSNVQTTPLHKDINFPATHWSARFLGRLKAPVSGTYTFGFWIDDGVRFWIDDSLMVNDWKYNGGVWDTCRVNLVAGKMYNIRAQYFQNVRGSQLEWNWRRPDALPADYDRNHSGDFDHNDYDSIPKKYLYPPVYMTERSVSPGRTQEDRVNPFRKPNHLSEVDVLNGDGRRYVYGIPVYNFDQEEVSFAVEKTRGNAATGLTGYTAQNTSANNQEGKDGYYSREKVPAYPHSFLLTGILSPDYVDVKGDGISDDDIGDAVKFEYSKTSGVANPYGWRAPYVADSATYNEGFRSYSRDDKGHYIYGTRELWYLHAIESKTMIATFTLQPRKDLQGVDEWGHRIDSSKAMCLSQIDLYSKADFLSHPGTAIPVKTVHFEYSYELCPGVNHPGNSTGKLTLKRIWFTYNGNNKGILNPYVFNYHPNNPGYKINMSDKWGTYKNPAQNPGATVANPITNAEYPYALQDSAAASYNAGAWALDSIQLPSGGRIKVNYESDDYAYVQNKRSTLMCKVAGIGTSTNGSFIPRLYQGMNNDGLYIYLKVPVAPVSNADLHTRYLDGIGKLYFRLCVSMPWDTWGSGTEYIPCYADLDTTQAQWYGAVSSNPNLIWVKIKGVNSSGDGNGSLSPLAQAAINFLRLNLPDKAFPGSEVSDNLGTIDKVEIALSLVSNITEFVNGFTNTARGNGWATIIDTSRSFARLDCPNFRKLGGGSRVHSVLIYDNWNAMTHKKETVYGQTYNYTTTQPLNGVSTTISSGVATWEPTIGSEENPFHLPIEFVQKMSIIGPAALQYSEEPLGESLYPAPSIGYSRVRVRSIHTTGTRSANGFSESTFYTSYDFPTTFDYSPLSNDTKKRYKPLLSNFLHINVQNYVAVSQGFKIELNDMNGKLRTQASYSETDSIHPLSYTENFYKTDNQSVQFKHLSNTVTTIDPQGNININATIGKDAEMMADMREQTTNITGANVNVNEDMFVAGAWPILIPSLLNLYQHETDRFRSVALTKVVQRYGILDSVVHFDRGSKVYVKNLLYDAETGAALLSRTQNEFNDSIFQFSYPSHWAYTGVGPAYQNIDAVLNHLRIRKGAIDPTTLPAPASTYLTSGDELLVYSKEAITSYGCDSVLAESFPDGFRLWVVDTSIAGGGASSLILIDQNGIPFTGNDVALKVVRSGHRNMESAVGSVTSLANPLVADGQGIYHLVFDSTRKVIGASANELQQFWRTADKRRSDIRTSCVFTNQDSALASQEMCTCIKPFFDYLIATHQLYPLLPWPRKTIASLATAAGIDLNACPLLNNNASGYLSVVNVNPFSYQAELGDALFTIRNVSGAPLDLYSMTHSVCNGPGQVFYKNPNAVYKAPDTATLNLYPVSSVNLISNVGTSCPTELIPPIMDTVSDRMLVENGLLVNGVERNTVPVLDFGRIDQRLPVNISPISARLILTADQRGHHPDPYNNANSTNLADSVSISLGNPVGWFPYLPLNNVLYQAYYSSWYRTVANDSPFKSINVDVSDYINGYVNGHYAATNFILTQGSGPLHSAQYDSASVAAGLIPPYMMSGYSNYYSTYYSRHYSDSSKWPVLQIKYLRGYDFDTTGAILEYNSTRSCSTVYGRSCFSSVTDTLVNPYQYALLGDYRPLRSYVYYGRRNETDPLQATNVRTNGVINKFAPFWQLQSGHWTPYYDSSRWVWNSQTTLYNRKGFEVENKDPLGRYNSGIYGYGLTLPTAVMQNSRYQESAFEGFEDYGFRASNCDTTCAESRPFDFSAYSANISDAAAHTGNYSLKVAKNSTISLVSLPVAVAPDPDLPQLTDTLNTDGCGTHFDGYKASASSVLPPFKPFAGKQMLVGGWVKEEDSCSCHTYANNHLLVNFSLSGGGDSAVTLTATGNMIEGWQRYEGIVHIPANATALTLTLQASASSATYFDDIRIHPFNAEMKSYIYNSVNLRLMAELDENNYATFYEYDDDGTLIRVKKETERGILTIKESRNALLKDQ